MRKSLPNIGVEWSFRSLLFFGLALICFSAPFVTGIPQVDESGLVPLVISEELLPPPVGMHAMMDGALEGPTGIPADHSILVLNNTIPEDNLIEGRIFDLPTGGLPSPLFGAAEFNQQMLRFEEFGTLENQVGLNPMPFPGTVEANALMGGGLDVDGLPIPAPELTALDCPDGAQVEMFLDQPLTAEATRLCNDLNQNPWKNRIENYLGRPTTNLPIEGRPPGEGWSHQRWAEFPPQRIFQSMITGARTNLGFRGSMQDHGYDHSLTGDDCEFGPGGLYYTTYDDPDGLGLSAGTTNGLAVKFHPSMPQQSPEALWTFDGTFPPKLLKVRYGEPVLMRLWNGLPLDPASNRGFGLHTISIHEHNGHNPAESDGYTNSFFFPGQYFDYRWPVILAGHDTINTDASDPRAGMPDGNGGIINIPGDWRETMSTHWFHDHMLDFTAQNVYKGVAAMMNYYSSLDRGNEALEDGINLRFPSGSSLDWGNRDYDINLVIADKAWDQEGQLWFNPFNSDGFMGDQLLTNWQYKPFFNVAARKYRFRILNGSVSRYLKLALVDQNNNRVPFHMICNDGNVMEHAVAFDGTLGTERGVLPTHAIAERYDIVVDFSQFQPGDRLYFVNLMEHEGGRKPEGPIPLEDVLSGAYQSTVLPTGYVGGDPCVGKFLEFRVQAFNGEDLSMNPQEYVAGGKTMIPLPRPNAEEIANATHRTFTFGRGSGTDNAPWTIKTDDGAGFTMDPRRVSAAPSLGDLEIWTIENAGNGWSHPVHIHFEEGQILSKDGEAPPEWEKWARKDVYRIGPMEDSCTTMEIALRFREFAGSYMEHCHNTQHEDHAMLLRWDIENPGQVNLMPSPLPTWEGVEYVDTVALPTFRVGDGVGTVDAIQVPVVGPPTADDDGDGIANACDPDQTGGMDCDLNGQDDACQVDTDLDGTIDPCDLDVDGDGILNTCDIDLTLGADCDLDGQDDNCQLDTDLDGTIDFCDTDLDGDGIPNECDADQTAGVDCDFNGQDDTCQIDTDLDGTIDPCDLDIDGDGIPNTCDMDLTLGVDCDANGQDDSCQLDTDLDGTIDLCDNDLDGDGILNACDVDQTAGADCDVNGQDDSCQVDTDLDGSIDACDADLDGDGILNACDVDQTAGADCDVNGQDDSCQVDTDLDGAIDACDDDLDGDGILNACDVDQTAGADCDVNGQDDSCQVDTDLDGSIDACDDDLDGDGFPNACDVDQTAGADCDSNGQVDSCQVDTDLDGTIDTCDDDLDGDGILNACDVDQTAGADCDVNGQDDSCQVDTDLDGSIDACDADLDGDGFPNTCDVDQTAGSDCDLNGQDDNCQIDTDSDGTIDTCDSDIDGDGILNACDIDITAGADCDLNGQDDSCQVDTDSDGSIDPCDTDLDGDGTPNNCDIDQILGEDCNTNGIVDSCDIANGAADTNSNGIPDECEPTPFIRGDVNSDSNLDVSDVIVTLGYLFNGGSMSCNKTADSNDDGVIDVADTIHLLGYLFGGNNDIPTPTSTCGIDPTEDALECETYGGCQ